MTDTPSPSPTKNPPNPPQGHASHSQHHTGLSGSSPESAAKFPPKSDKNKINVPNKHPFRLTRTGRPEPNPLHRGKSAPTRPRMSKPTRPRVKPRSFLSPSGRPTPPAAAGPGLGAFQAVLYPSGWWSSSARRLSSPCPGLVSPALSPPPSPPPSSALQSA